jgi:hypothetical protein
MDIEKLRVNNEGTVGTFVRSILILKKKKKVD